MTLKERETENSGRFVFPIRLIASKIEGGEERKNWEREKNNSMVELTRIQQSQIPRTVVNLFPPSLVKT